jgi:hypothetical protein
MNLLLMNLMLFGRIFVAFNMSIVCVILHGVLILVARGHCLSFGSSSISPLVTFVFVSPSEVNVAAKLIA